LAIFFQLLYEHVKLAIFLKTWLLLFSWFHPKIVKYWKFLRLEVIKVIPNTVKSSHKKYFSFLPASSIKKRRIKKQGRYTVQVISAESDFLKDLFKLT
jgi:hypothetical protein